MVGHWNSVHACRINGNSVDGEGHSFQRKQVNYYIVTPMREKGLGKSGRAARGTSAESLRQIDLPLGVFMNIN